MNASTRCGYICFIGAPNAGKSTLLNQCMGTKLSIVTPKAQTTRSRITGVMIHNNAQLIFLDVPGVFNAGKPFERAMVQAAWASLHDADIVAFMHDVTRLPSQETQEHLARLSSVNKRRILLLNKVDALKEKPKLIAQVAWFQERLAFDNVFMISAKTGDGVADFLRDVASHVPNGPFLYDEDTMTDLPMRLLASEITREQCFFKLREELPYALSVETEQYNMREDGSVEIRQVVIVENERQKMIVIGKGGAMLKKIGQAARFEMKQHLGITAHVFLFVKVREDWKQNPESYRYMGLTAPGSN